MPYREVARPSACHPSLPAIEGCIDCRRELCESCVCFDAMGARCESCARKARRAHVWRRRGWLGAALLVVIALSGVGCWVIARASGNECAPECMPSGTAERVEELLRQRSPESALEYLDACSDQCTPGLERRATGSRFLAHRKLGQSAAALEDVDGLLRRAPHDDFLRFWHIAAL
jgi:hypothetical protein